ncbi:unnamed protein product [Kuraishia capsulata CBS 1993]|uniref:mRNA decay factor PAT1 domain-containing protein n=1 Tax=Kuraishia capsulata CBS 1993 TaxID=1382522 RepID=W6MJ67_9ASCO|nr:uncharacterized protein KUCA_T00001964001 [Kuraishia capsulata CBS 1993]CDK25993.1 unnamed protein product [Kuraishia capsulata CBS 1993]
MSFFGFDTSGPPKADKDLQTLDFEDTYEGLGEHPEEEEDAFNDETFGADIKTGRDFDFGTAQPQAQHLSYAQAAQKPIVEDVLKPMASLWSDQTVPEQQPQRAPTSGPKVLSLEEIEAQLMGRPVQPPQMMQPQMYGQNGYPFIMPPNVNPQQFQQFQQQFGGQLPPGFMFPPQGYPGQPPMFMPGMPNQQGIPPQLQQQHLHQFQQAQAQQAQQVPAQFQVQHGQPQGPPQVQQVQQQQQQQQQQAQPVHPQAQAQAQAPIPAPAPQPQAPAQPAETQAQAPAQTPAPSQPQSAPRAQASSNGQKLPLDEFPVLGSASVREHPTQPAQQQSYQQRQYSQHSQNPQYLQNPQNRGRIQRPRQDLTPEEREKLIIRSNKVARITRSSGFMTPRDKDFVTRFQLSQIVSQDPFNEDFYHQIFKILRNPGGGAEDMSYIAQKYLDQSGHRLGGKNRRADVALQRMQQQISKAVTVAKERGERTGTLAREGALGKVSIGSIRQPRKQLVVKRSENATEDELKQLNRNPAKISKFTRQAQLNIIEKVYSILLGLETLEREAKPISTEELFEALHVLDVVSDEEEHPFISLLGYEKGMRLFSRCFHLLTPDQKNACLLCLFGNLQKLNVVLRGSYKNYETSNFVIPEAVEKKINVFQMTVMKTLVLYISEASFEQVLRFIIELESSNSVLFVCTSKIGLSLITVLISRLELIKQESNANLSEAELEAWSLTYDKLFANLEERLVLIYPPTLSSSKSASFKPDDDSYIWQFLASVALAGKLQHQRVIVDEVRDEIFGIMGKARVLSEEGNSLDSAKFIGNLNLFLNVMGLKASETDISEL